jgi:hypothetical protein
VINAEIRVFQHNLENEALSISYAPGCQGGGKWPFDAVEVSLRGSPTLSIARASKGARESDNLEQVNLAL